MATEVAIYNMALAHIKSKSVIAATDEKSTEAKKCTLFYHQSLDETLESFDWHFAKKHTTLPTVGDAPLGWAYQYAYPTECVAIREVLTAIGDADPIPYEVAHSELNDALVILTDREAAHVRYTKRVTNTVLFSPLFVSALSYKLASYIAMSLSGKRELRDEANTLFDIMISRAKASSLNQTQHKEDSDASWITGR